MRACSATSGTGEELLATLERWARGAGDVHGGSRPSSRSCFVSRSPTPSASRIRRGRRPWASRPAASTSGLCTCAARCRASVTTAAVGLSLIGEQAHAAGRGRDPRRGRPRASAGPTSAHSSPTSRCRAYCAVDHLSRGCQARRTRAGGSSTPRPACSGSGRSRLGGGRPDRCVWRIIQLLQNIDLIIAKHQFSISVASSYAVAAVAGKVLIWVAMGASFYLVPETSRRRSVRG